MFFATCACCPNLRINFNNAILRGPGGILRWLQVGGKDNLIRAKVMAKVFLKTFSNSDPIKPFVTLESCDPLWNFMGMRVCHVPASPTCDARTTHDAPNPCQIERNGNQLQSNTRVSKKETACTCCLLLPPAGRLMALYLANIILKVFVFILKLICLNFEIYLSEFCTLQTLLAPTGILSVMMSYNR